MPSVLEIIINNLDNLNDRDLESFRTQIDNELLQRRDPVRELPTFLSRITLNNTLRDLFQGLTQLSRQDLIRLRSITEAAIWRRRAQRYRDEDAITLDLLRSEQGDLLCKGWSQDQVQLAQQIERRSALRDRIRYYEERERLLSEEDRALLRQRRETAETARKARDRVWRESKTPYVPEGLSLEALHYRLGSATRASQHFNGPSRQDQMAKFAQELLRVKLRRIIQDTLHPENRIPEGVSEDQAYRTVGDALLIRVRGKYPEIEATAGVVLELMEWDVEDVVPMLTDDEYLDEMVPRAVRAMEEWRERVEWGAEAGLI